MPLLTRRRRETAPASLPASAPALATDTVARPSRGIRVRGVSKRYGATTVVDAVDLDLPAEGLTCLVGPNGAGKSTLLSIVARLLPADDGTVTVDGMDVARCDSSHLARRLAILRQENYVELRLRVRELVAFGRYPHSRGRLTATDHGHVDRALAYLGLDDLADRFLDELSGGQRQRACIAMVLAQDTDYLLLDEPLNNLDMRHQLDILRLLRRAVDELGTTVVVVVHDLNAAAVFADRVVAMRDGAVVADGTPDEVMRPELLEEVFGLPVDVVTHHGRPVGHFLAR